MRDRTDDLILNVGFEVEDLATAAQRYLLLELHPLDLNTGELEIENVGVGGFDMTIHILCLAIP